jgi:hypothetical protein
MDLKKEKKEKKEKKTKQPNPAAHSPPLLNSRRPNHLSAHTARSARLPSLSLSRGHRQVRPTCRGRPLPPAAAPPFFPAPPPAFPAVPGRPAPVHLLHCAINGAAALRHRHLTSSPPVTAAPSRPPPPLKVGRSSSHSTASAPFPLPSPPYKGAAPPPAPPAPPPRP